MKRAPSSKQRRGPDGGTGAPPAVVKKAHRAEGGAKTATRAAAPDLTAAGVAVLRWVLAPATHDSDGGAVGAVDPVPDFMSAVLEQQPLHVAARSPEHFGAAGVPEALRALLPDGVAWSTERMRAAVAGGAIRYGTDINVVRFDPKLQRRVPLKTEGVVPVEEYDAALAAGWSVRYLRPQEHSRTLSSLLFLFDEAMQCSTGMNTYWTPPKSQGFAPHYDDVDVFMLQLEGSKRWRVYPPPGPEDELCRVSSPDYLPADMPAPTLDVWLRAGEVLYLPRGWVHQGITSETEHSLHVTLSAFQQHTYGDVLKAMLAYKVDAMMAADVELRRALPVHWLTSVGSIYNPKVMGPFAAAPHAPGAGKDAGPDAAQQAGQKVRAEVQRRIRAATAALAADVATKDGIIDKGADLFAVEVLSRRQPPPLLPVAPEANDDGGAQARLCERAEGVDPAAVTALRLVSQHAARVVVQGTEVELHHCGGNSLVCLGDADIAPVVKFDIAFAPALACIAAKYPGWAPVARLPFPELDDDAEEVAEARLQLVAALLATNVVQWRTGGA